VDAQTQIIALLILLIAFVVNALVRRREAGPMRPIGAITALPTMTGESIESSRPLHVALGQATIGDDSTLLTMVGKEFIYYLTRRVAVGDTPPIFSVADSAALPLALATMRRAYGDENRSQPFNVAMGRWYPSGTKSLAYAAAIMAMQVDDQVTGNMLTGRFGVELALILDASNRQNRPSIAVSDLLTGQAVAYVLAQEALIGEEIFAAAGYLSDDVRLANRNIITDYLRYVLVLAIIALAIAVPLLDAAGS